MKRRKKQAKEPDGGGGGPVVEGFINKAEVGKRLKMQPRTINDWMKRGLVPYYKVGHSVRFKWSEVEAYLSQTCRVCQEA